jgi:hypothetical protein
MENTFNQPSSLPAHITSQTTWHFSLGDNFLNLTDGQGTYSFVGNLNSEDAELKKVPDVPPPDFYNHATSKGKAQVHRSDPTSIHFTIQDGRNNPTYTIKHEGDDVWRVYQKNQEQESRERALMLQELVTTDPVISKFPIQNCVEAFQELLVLAPELCSEKEVVRQFMRQAGARKQIDESEAAALIAQNRRLFELHQRQKRHEGKVT